MIKYLALHCHDKVCKIIFCLSQRAPRCTCFSTVMDNEEALRLLAVRYQRTANTAV